MVIYKVIAHYVVPSISLRAKRLGVNDIQAPAAFERLRLFLNTLPPISRPNVSISQQTRRCPLGQGGSVITTTDLWPHLR